MGKLNQLVILSAALAVLLPVSNAAAQEYFQNMPAGFEVIADTEIPWISGPDYPGSELAFLYGNPSEEGFYVMRIKFLSGTKSTPHFHDKDRNITVLQGTWWVGLSNDLADMQPLEPGSFMVHPLGKVHFDGSMEGEIIIEVRGMGPVASTAVPSIDSREQ